MKAIDFPESNFTYTVPQELPNDVDPESFYDLHCYKGVTADGLPLVLSCWEFTDEDIEFIVKNRKIWQMTYATRIAPMTLLCEHPFVEAPETANAETNSPDV